jgi:hypothetical protein
MASKIWKMQRTDLLDTSMEMHQQRIKLLQDKGVEWRIQKTIELIRMSQKLFPDQTRRAVLTDCLKKCPDFPISQADRDFLKGTIGEY